MEKQQRKSKPRIDITGKKYGRLTPQYYIKGGKWHCICDCGNELDVDTRNLNSNHTQSCGCLQKEIASKNTINMENYEDNNFKVLERNDSSSGGIAYWKCLCKHCGNIFTVKGSTIRSKNTSSCGCIHSLGEQKIIQLLTENKCEFATQYTFPDLLGIGGRNLRFDFAIFNQGRLVSLIEYNGLQHYQKPSGKWGIEWEHLIENDKRKQEYCQSHNIQLKIIKYNESFDIYDLI